MISAILKVVFKERCYDPGLDFVNRDLERDGRWADSLAQDPANIYKPGEIK
jgi:hypothetical protein